MKIITRLIVFLILSHGFILNSIISNGSAAMQLLSEEEMQDVSAEAGVTIYLDADIEVSFKNFGWEDLSGNKLLFKLVSLAEPGKKSFRFDGPFVLDIGQSSSGKGIIYNQYPGFSGVDLDIKFVLFMDNDMGSMHFKGTTLSDFHIYTAGHGGLDLEIGGKLSIDRFAYDYNSNEKKSLFLDKLDFCESFSGGTSLYSSGGPDANNPDGTNPSPPGGASGASINTSWAGNGSFKFGDINNNPMQIDVGTSGNSTAIQMNVPMTGSIRAQNVSLTETNFGPIAIDGIKVDLLRFNITPN